MATPSVHRVGVDVYPRIVSCEPGPAHIFPIRWRHQALSRIDTSREQAAKAVVYGLSQVLLATKVTLGRQDRRVPQKELYLFQFATIYMTELCAGAPKIMRGEMVEFQTLGTAIGPHTRPRFRRYRSPRAFHDDSPP